MQDNEEQKTDPSIAPQGAVAPVGGTSAVRLSPSAAVAPAGIGGTGGAGTTAPAAAGGQFASLNQYINANQGQAEPLAGKLTTGIGKQYDTLAGQNTSTLNNIGGQVAAQAVPNANATLEQEAANPVSFTSNPSNIASFQKLLGATYSGPASTESTSDYTTQQDNINKAINEGKNATQTEAGRENLLSQNEATPTSGVTALNSAILSQSPEALNKVETAYQPFSNLVTGLQAGATDINKQIAQNQADIQQANKAANSALAGQVSGLNKAVNDTVAQDEANRQAYNTQLQDYQDKYSPISTNINSLNELFSKAAAQGVPYSQVTNPFASALKQGVNNNIATAQTVATPDQYRQAQAFEALLKGINSGIPVPVLNQNTVDQAGTYAAPDAFNGPQGSATTQELAKELAGAVAAGNSGPQLPTQWNAINPIWNTLMGQLNLNKFGNPIQ